MTAVTDGSKMLGLVTMPPRLSLYRLDGLNIGTGYVESLSSFLARLAHKCRVAPWLLFHSEVAPRLGRSPPSDIVEWNRPYLVGSGEVTERVCAALETLTGASKLIGLTLRPLANVVSRESVARRQMWCPLCLREMASVGTLYYPLLWRLKAVSACPRHEVALAHECCCAGSSTIPRMQRKYFPGICPNCGKLLYASSNLAASAASAGAVAESTAVLNLLADSGRIARLSRGEILANVMSFLSKASRDAFNDTAAHLAEALGYKKNTIWHWQHGRGLPSLEALARLATMFGVPIADILCGACTVQLKVASVTLESRELRRRRPTNTAADYRREMCHLRAHSSSPLSIYRMARILEVDSSQLWKADRVLAGEISSAAKQFRDGARTEWRQKLHAIFEKEAQRIAATGIVPTQRLVVRNCSDEIGWPGREVKKMCAKICADVRDSCWPGRRKHANGTDTSIAP
jgi:transcriptional regulator with XRE-family HTH domain